MITTMKLKYPSPHVVTILYVCVSWGEKNTQDLFFEQISSIQYSIINYTHHALH